MQQRQNGQLDNDKLRIERNIKNSIIWTSLPSGKV